MFALICHKGFSSLVLTDLKAELRNSDVDAPHAVAKDTARPIYRLQGRASEYLVINYTFELQLAYNFNTPRIIYSENIFWTRFTYVSCTNAGGSSGSKFADKAFRTQATSCAPSDSL